VERGGVYIAYQVVGSGPVDLLFFHGFISHLEIGWENPEYAAFFEQLGRVARVILFDKRGVGLSDRVRGAPTLEQTVGDAVAVLDAVGSKRAFVLGTSEGGAACCSRAAPGTRARVAPAGGDRACRTHRRRARAALREEFD
jgi:pimeloyl-ACP methyl ester carboxylesterase